MLEPADNANVTCSCPSPVPVERATRKGAAQTECLRCGRPIPLRLTAGKHTPERCVEVAFRFLLDREPKESILARFDLSVITRYFPEYEVEIKRKLSNS